MIYPRKHDVLMYQSIPSAITPPPPGNPRAFEPCSAPHSGAFDANRSPTHRAFDPSKKCWSSVAREKDFVLHVTSHNSSWFSTKFMLIYVISSALQYSEICHYRKFGTVGVGSGGESNKAWDRETMFSQLAKRSARQRFKKGRENFSL